MRFEIHVFHDFFYSGMASSFASPGSLADRCVVMIAMLPALPFLPTAAALFQAIRTKRYACGMRHTLLSFARKTG